MNCAAADFFDDASTVRDLIRSISPKQDTNKIDTSLMKLNRFVATLVFLDLYGEEDEFEEHNIAKVRRIGET